MRQLTTHGTAVRDSDPAYSPDGRRIAFSRDGRIFVMRADGTNPRQVTFGTEPAFSPSGKRIVYVSGRSDCHDLGTHLIFRARIDGTRVKQLTRGGECTTDLDPAWSPDGKWIVFSHDNAGARDLFLIKPNGSDRTRLRVRKSADLDPDWAPDGRRILLRRFAHRDRAQLEGIWTITRRGRHLRRIHNGRGVERNPVFSPDGSQIAFTIFPSLDRDAEGQILTLPRAGGEPQALTPDAMDARAPSWQPR